jgi:hypothetical protein
MHTNGLPLVRRGVAVTGWAGPGCVDFVAMQGMISGVLLVAAFAAAAAASGFVAVRLYRVSGAAARSQHAASTQDPPDA